jgi:hypothetical protein
MTQRQRERARQTIDRWAKNDGSNKEVSAWAYGFARMLAILGETELEDRAHKVADELLVKVSS